MYNGEEFRKYAVKGRGMNGLSVDKYVRHIENLQYHGQGPYSPIVSPYGAGVPTVESMTRSVIEERPTRFAEIDVFSRLIMDRIIFLGMGVDDNIANIIVAQLLFLQSVDAKKDILLYINSPGGSVYAGLGIYDTMQLVKPDVATICTSLAASMAAVLLCGGAEKKRSALPHARIMIHQPSGGAQGQSKDIEITAKQIILLRKELYEIISKHSGQPFEKIEEDSDRDYWMKSDEAKEYGLIDEVLTGA
ncbi:ATP-dependent Clp protease, protease subunit [Catalinimonas alkaloidigena]|uniref:ATP-dependent Clp protease proteolytic subunit n=1 Tax=Catalinimonas alkaloidigena TaxID=1075417 RepID=A0A1G9GW71_9BACT|nr:ATP-dependent Clp protease proteolytic subunit [Catalinimonas alkaloidigena]SDL04908.1 ATP-dependent Clp protease, protease subunit [Catalinimonas alkaloidigena]